MAWWEDVCWWPCVWSLSSGGLNSCFGHPTSRRIAILHTKESISTNMKWMGVGLPPFLGFMLWGWWLVGRRHGMFGWNPFKHMWLGLGSLPFFLQRLAYPPWQDKVLWQEPHFPILNTRVANKSPSLDPISIGTSSTMQGSSVSDSEDRGSKASNDSPSSGPTRISTSFLRGVTQVDGRLGPKHKSSSDNSGTCDPIRRLSPSCLVISAHSLHFLPFPLTIWLGHSQAKGFGLWHF